MAAAVRKLGFQKYPVREIFFFSSEYYWVKRNLHASKKYNGLTDFPLLQVASLLVLFNSGYT